jgi:hypothetical protein
VGILRWLFRKSGDTPPRARCPKCGQDIQPFWKKDELVQVIGTLRGDHQVLYATCVCGWAGRVNNPKVIPGAMPRK